MNRAQGIAFLGALLFGLGCAQVDSPTTPEKKVRPKVNLPAPPDLTPVVIKTHTADGAYTVAGLFASGRKLFEKKVRVHGAVIDRHLCPPPAEGDAPCYPPPNLFLAEGLDATKQQLLVVGSNEAVARFQTGENVTLEGTFSQWSGDRVFVRSEGLIVLSPLASEEEAAP